MSGVGSNGSGMDYLRIEKIEICNKAEKREKDN
jgi:hypothetical protein